ncbi:amidohydrolase family protein [Pareuzebyella sediminis]|uniref:amidohydrolase family protein n=1 Tax=Pareuzebyella sediminis TaxID=2607998 RepID=UPI0011EE2539|nr:amidohydrolase family protein [Pareuzebyella sediminis]
MRKIVYVLSALIGFAACKSSPEKETVENQPLGKNEIRKIDVHSHFQYDRDYFPEFFDEWNMQAILVDVAHQDATEIRRSWDNYVALANARPELFYLCSSLIGVGIDAPDFAEKQIARLKTEIEQGAIMVKVWKNFGMVTKDASGSFIQIDDDRLQPIWDFLTEEGIPVMAHIGEPIQAWRPLDDPNNPHYGYYSEHPQYHAYQHPEIPKYETIMAARDHWIEKNPDLQILCAHTGSMSHNVDMVAERLDKFPNIRVEPAARFGDLASQDSKKVKAFFEKYQDRIFFGTDYGNNTPKDSLSTTELNQERANLDSEYEILWKYLSTSDSVEIRRQKNVGIGLSKDILEKVYYNNVADFLNLQ